MRKTHPDILKTVGEYNFLVVREQRKTETKIVAVEIFQKNLKMAVNSELSVRHKSLN